MCVHVQEDFGEAATIAAEHLPDTVTIEEVLG